MSEVKMTTAELLEMLSTYGEQHGSPEDFEQARAAVAALVAERDGLQVGHDALLTVRETLKRECEALKAENARLRRAPTGKAARLMGAIGSPTVEAERFAFEAWVSGHCWELGAVWNRRSYVGLDESGEAVCPHAIRTRMMWAAWRDRAALAGAGHE